MSSPETPPLQPDPPAPRSRNIWIALGLYIAGAGATILLDQYFSVAWDRGRGSFIPLGPYGLVIKAAPASGDISALTTPLFLVASMIFLALLLPAVSLRRSGFQFAIGIAAGLFWLFCGFIVDVARHFTW